MKRIPAITMLIILLVSISTCFVFANDSEEPVTGPGNTDDIEIGYVIGGTGVLSELFEHYLENLCQ
jgi:hypothetical protein